MERPIRQVTVTPAPSIFTRTWERTTLYLDQVVSYVPSSKIVMSAGISFVFGVFSNLLLYNYSRSLRKIPFEPYGTFASASGMIMGFGWLSGKHVSKFIDFFNVDLKQTSKKINFFYRFSFLGLFLIINCFSIHDLIYKKGQAPFIWNLYLAIFSGALSAYYFQKTKKNQ